VTPLYKRIVAHAVDSGDIDLTNKVWDNTPWVINVNTGSPSDYENDRLHGMIEWCTLNLGPEAWPIHDKPGNWYRSGATVMGETFIGFHTECMMNDFMLEHPKYILDKPTLKAE